MTILNILKELHCALFVTFNKEPLNIYLGNFFIFKKFYMCINYNMPDTSPVADVKISFDQIHSVFDGLLPIEVKYSGLIGNPKFQTVSGQVPNGTVDDTDYMDITTVRAKYVLCDAVGKLSSTGNPRVVKTVDIPFTEQNFNGMMMDSAGKRFGRSTVSVPFSSAGLNNDSIYKMYLEVVVNYDNKSYTIKSTKENTVTGNASFVPIVQDNKTPVNFSSIDPTIEFVEFTADWGSFVLLEKHLTLVDNNNDADVTGTDYSIPDVVNGIQKIVLCPVGKKPAAIDQDSTKIYIEVTLTANHEYTLVLSSTNVGLVTRSSETCPTFTYFSGTPAAPKIVAVDTDKQILYVVPGDNATDLQYYVTADYQNGLPWTSMVVEANGVKFDVATAKLISATASYNSNMKGALQDSILNNYRVDSSSLNLFAKGAAFNRLTKRVQYNVKEAELSSTLLSLEGAFEVPILKEGGDLTKAVFNAADVAITVQQVHTNKLPDGLTIPVYSTASNSVTSNLSVLAKVEGLTASNDWFEEGDQLRNDLRLTANVRYGTSSTNNIVVKIAKKDAIDAILNGSKAEFSSAGVLTKPAAKARGTALTAADYTQLTKDTDYTIDSNTWAPGATNSVITHVIKINGDRLKELGYHIAEQVELAVVVTDGNNDARTFDRSTNAANVYVARAADFGTNATLAISGDLKNNVYVAKLSNTVISFGNGLEASFDIRTRIEKLQAGQDALKNNINLMRRMPAGATPAANASIFESIFVNLFTAFKALNPTTILTAVSSEDKTNYKTKNESFKVDLDARLLDENKNLAKSQEAEKKAGVAFIAKFYKTTANEQNFDTLEQSGMIATIPLSMDDAYAMTTSAGARIPVSFANAYSVSVALNITSNGRNVNDFQGRIFRSSNVVSNSVSVKATLGPVSSPQVNQSTDGSVVVAFDKLLQASGYTVKLTKNGSSLAADNKEFTITDAGTDFDPDRNKQIYKLIIKSYSSLPLPNLERSIDRSNNTITYTYYHSAWVRTGDFLSINVVPTGPTDKYSAVPANLTVIPSSKLTVSNATRSSPEPTDPNRYDEILTFDITPNGQNITKCVFLAVFGDNLMDESDYSPVGELHFDNAETQEFPLDKTLDTKEFYSQPALAKTLNGSELIQVDPEKNLDILVYKAPVFDSRIIRSVDYTSASTSKIGGISDKNKLAIRIASHEAKVADFNAKKGTSAAINSPADSLVGAQGVFLVVSADQKTSKPTTGWKTWSAY